MPYLIRRVYFGRFTNQEIKLWGYAISTEMAIYLQSLEAIFDSMTTEVLLKLKAILNPKVLELAPVQDGALIQYSCAFQ